ncbi:energy transducer TonB [Pseudoxanthomonas gei]|uniref:Energy transducer TonB n=1 Tax=Pseudoxanthomonas gei TaxID=1383030 RepID=A0ABX0ADL4_9GAMM|nr:energy transducer TonB [Pseudoxanthomonas gei]NDK39657.1 energy transducer TonB [Pseudoxanthomonas gei]
MVRTLPLRSETRPEPARILAITAAIAVHAFAFMLLLIPMAAPVPDATLADQKPVIDWWLPKTVPVTPRPPQVVPVRKQESKPQPQPRLAQDTATPVSDPVIVEQGTVATEQGTAASSDAVTSSGELSQPISGVQLEYELAKAPPYPREAFRDGLQGQVLLKILVDADGRPLEVVVSTSSGHRVLDEAARRFVLKNWRFKPALRDGHAVQAYGMVPINFTLE